MKGEKLARISFWKSRRANKYDDFVLKIPSNFPAQALAMYLMKIKKGENVLDFGCFKGGITEYILRNTNAEYVAGTDIIPEYITEAQSRYPDTHNLEFFLVNNYETIPTPHGLYNSVAMFFVHPNIETRSILKNAFQRINDVMAKGGKLVLMGLHPNAVSLENKFNFYKPELYPNSLYDDEIIFTNELKNASGESFPVKNICWKEDTLQELLTTSGFNHVEIIPVAHGLKGKNLQIFKTVLNNITEELKLTWQDEWQSPLYQIIVATK